MTREIVLVECPRHGITEHNIQRPHGPWECQTCIDLDHAAEREWLDAQDRVRVGWSVPDEDPLYVSRWYDDLELADRGRRDRMGL